jgi:hypothetical protein
MSLKSPVLLFAVLLAVVSLAGQSATGSHQSESSIDADQVVDPLDRVVQKRFHDVIGFGMARIGSERWFLPETREEKDAVKTLNSGGYQVSLYLVGRAILQEVTEKYRVSKAQFGSNDHLMSGPMFVGSRRLKGLPDGRTMWEPSREALRQFAAGSERYSFDASGWRVAARPVRASSESCLKCHGFDTKLTFQKDGSMMIGPEQRRNELHEGDPLGVLLYVYRKAH